MRTARSCCSSRLDSKLVDGAVAQRLGERLVHEAMLLEQRETRKTVARDDHLEVVAAAGPILDNDLARIGKGVAQQVLESLGGHALTLAAGLWVEPRAYRRRCVESRTMNRVASSTWSAWMLWLSTSRVR